MDVTMGLDRLRWPTIRSHAEIPTTWRAGVLDYEDSDLCDCPLPSGELFGGDYRRIDCPKNQDVMWKYPLLGRLYRDSV